MSEARPPELAEGRPALGASVRRWLMRPEAPALVFLVLLMVVFSLTANGPTDREKESGGSRVQEGRAGHE